MRYKDTQNALAAGHRQFTCYGISGPVDVTAWGMKWVRFKGEHHKYPISTNMKMFSMMVEGIYTEKSPESASGQ